MKQNTQTTEDINSLIEWLAGCMGRLDSIDLDLPKLVSGSVPETLRLLNVIRYRINAARSALTEAHFMFVWINARNDPKTAGLFVNKIPDVGAKHE